LVQELPGAKTFYVETFGCQMNERDSETIAGLLTQNGMKQTLDPKIAGVIVLNTCAVRESAENKVWSRLGKIHAMRRGGPEPVLVLAGCMAQLPETLTRVRARAPYVQVITGPGHVDKIPQLVRESLGRRQPVLVAVSPGRSETKNGESIQALPEGLPRAVTPGVSAYVNVMYGCDNFCSYCIVPYVRGPQVSRSPEAIIKEVSDLSKQGYREITLLGQNVNAYGLDIGTGSYGFANLLRDLGQVEGLVRLRYFTSHPRDFSRDMVDAVRDSASVCEHFHLPLQSGSDRILSLMNRGYDRQHYLDLRDYIMETVPEASLTTDIIVGFPGETEEDFEDTLDMVRRCRFDGAFTFIFSPRKGTAAARMKNQVDAATKSRRLQELVKVQGNITREINERLIGNTVEVLVEESSGHNTPNGPEIKGRTRTNKMVVAFGEAAPGRLVNVRIDEAGTWYLRGQII
jgi:tRNA-2-methylthio-N6-dimethylallyladenosine synthase